MKKALLRISAVVLSFFVTTLVDAATDWSAQDYDLYPGNFDGDTQTDLLYVAKDASKASGIARASGGAPTVAFQSWPSNYLGIPWWGNQYTIHVADFNGDGKADVFLQRKTPGDSYLLFADSNGKIIGINQVIPYTYLGLYWSADQHKIVTGDFNGDGTKDLFLQAVTPTGLNAVVVATASGFASVQQSWSDINSVGGLKWSSKDAIVHAGDFNGDGLADLLVQARPKFVMIDYDIPIPVPTYPPNMNGIALAQWNSTTFTSALVQTWSRNAHGADWSPLSSNVVVGDFNGDGRADVALQARTVGRNSYLVNGNASGSVFTTSTQLANSVTWSADSYRLMAGNFDGTGGAGIYYQALAPSGTNLYANTITGGSVSTATHSTSSATGVVTASAVGHTVGSFAVSNSGSATYSIPITVPPGVSGIQPALSINYQSGGGNGLLGVGWGLSGFSEIERCGKTLAQDGVTGGVTLGLADRFCLDGNKLRLTAGTYGAAGSTYQTEMETFSRVTAADSAGNGPAYFVVESKNGLIYEYGNSADSRIESLAAGFNTTPHTWALNRVRDRHGNTMTITYQEDGAPNGSFRPLRIDYTSNSNAALAPAYAVRFIWESRPTGDMLQSYLAGGLVKETNRLARVETLYNNALVRKYTLSYNTSGNTPRSRLGAIQECDAAGNCLAPTMISWQEGYSGFAAETSGSNLGNLGANALPIDINGDGKTDLVYPSTSNWCYALSNGPSYAAANCTSTAHNNKYANAVPIDYNVDGKTDLLVPSASNQWQVLQFNGAGFSTTQTSIPAPAANGGTAFAADINGDGRQDLVYLDSSTATVLLARLNSVSGLSSTPITVFADPEGFTISTTAYDGAQGGMRSILQTADFNGDSRVDLLVASYTELFGSFMIRDRILKSSSNGYVIEDSNSTEGFAFQTWRGLDVNGDGATDVAYACSAAVWCVRLGTGSGLGAEINTGVSRPGSTVNAIALDWDSDGRMDLLQAGASGNWQLVRSTGETFSAPVDTGLPATGASNAMIADVDGDGLNDIVYVDSGNTWRYRLHKASIPDLVSSIADGFGNSMSVAYAPLTDSTIYTKGTSAAYPDVDVQAPMYVVKKYTASDGLGGTYDVNHTYSGLRANTLGRGLLGFASLRTTDSRSGIKTRTDFRQDFPFIGMASYQEVAQPNGKSITATITNPLVLNLDSSATNGRYFPYPQTVFEYTYEVGGVNDGAGVAVKTSTVGIDGFGNTVQTTVSTRDVLTNETWTIGTNNTITSDSTCAWRGFVTQQVSRGRTVQYELDTTNPAACRVYKEIVEPNDTTNTMKVTTTIGYDAFGHPNSQTVSAQDVASRTTSSDYGPQGVFPISVTNALSQTANKTFNYALGVPLTATDPNALQAQYAYDGFGRLIQESRPDGTKAAYIYSSCTVANGYCGDNKLRYRVEKRELDTSNGVIRSSSQLFDAFGRSLYDQPQSLTGAFAIVATVYDNQGRVAQRSQPYFTGYPAYFTTFGYDLVGRATQEQRRVSDSDAAVQTTYYEYDRLTYKQRDANSTGPTDHLTKKKFNAIGQVVEVTDALNGVTKYEYDPVGNLTKTIDPLNNEVRSVFNIRGFKTSMRDADMGAWTYTYYPTGELRTQTDAKSQVATFTYDRLGRPLTRTEAEGTTTFTYGASATLRNIGKLESVASPGAYSESYTYDSLGRVQNATTNADAASFVVSNSYNSTTGLLETTTYPISTTAVAGSRFKVKYEYDYGLLKRTLDFNTPATIYWEQVATNAAGQAIDEQLGNGLHTYSTYDGVTGLLGTRTTGGTAQVQYLTYQWDKVGNLSQRKDNNLNFTEDFYYDSLYRLDYSKLNGVTNLDVGYDASGNITSKSDVGSFTYPAFGANSVRPHAAINAGSNSYGYDANGNMNLRNGSATTWYSYNLPNRVNKGSNYSQFFYGAGRSRYKQIAVTTAGGSLPAGTETTIYVAGLFEKVTKLSGVIEYKHYIQAGNAAVAQRTLRSNGVNDTRYLHQDHLGSVDVITNEAGGVVQRLSYDAFGKRRNVGPPGATDWTNVAAITQRGFTFHEALDNVDLVHMNGRVYDANIGRFISADPFIQAPLMSQSFNRYSYVVNNPLSMTDPSGYSWLSKGLRSVGRHVRAITKFHYAPTLRNLFEAVRAGPGQKSIDQYVMTHDWAYKVGYAAAVVSSWWIGGYGGAIYQSYYTYVATGSTTQAFTVGLIAAAQQYASNYFSTGSGFQMPTGGSAFGAAPNSARVYGTPNLVELFISTYANAPGRPLYTFDSQSRDLIAAVALVDSIIPYSGGPRRLTIDVRVDDAYLEKLRTFDNKVPLGTALVVDQTQLHFKVVLHSNIFKMRNNLRAWFVGHELVHVDQFEKMGLPFGSTSGREAAAHRWADDTAGELAIPRSYVDWNRRYIKAYSERD
jgi:RHS repeat-associated protein